jgi:putative oxidoreductase
MMFQATDQQRRIGLAVLRVAIGIVFVAHAWLKFTKMGHTGVTGFFTQLGIPAPGIAAWANMFVEAIGGAALILGAFTRVFAIALAIDMLGAIAYFHARNGFFIPDGVEFVGTLLAGLVCLAIAGAGAASIDERTHAAS